MTAKEWLSQVRTLDQKINNRIEEIDRLRASLYYKGINYDKEPVSGGVPVSSASVVAKIVDYEKDLQEEIDAFIDLKKEILKKLDKLTDSDYVRLLYLRYFKFKKWEEIAVELNYTHRWVLSLHGRALHEVEKILKTSF